MNMYNAIIFKISILKILLINNDILLPTNKEKILMERTT